jgi:hypothetical protein
LAGAEAGVVAEGDEGADAAPVEFAEPHEHERVLPDRFDLLSRLGQLGGMPFVTPTADSGSEMCDRPAANHAVPDCRDHVKGLSVGPVATSGQV